MRMGRISTRDEGRRAQSSIDLSERQNSVRPFFSVCVYSGLPGGAWGSMGMLLYSRSCHCPFPETPVLTSFRSLYPKSMPTVTRLFEGQTSLSRRCPCFPEVRSMGFGAGSSGPASLGLLMRSRSFSVEVISSLVPKGKLSCTGG